MSPLSPEQLMAQYKLAAVAPEVVLLLAALAVLLAGAFFPEQAGRRFLPFLALGGAVSSAIAIGVLWNQNLSFGLAERAIFSADNFALFFKGLFLLSLIVTILISGRFLKARTGDRHTVIGEYYGLLLMCTIGMMMVASARDLLVVFLGIETLSIALYVLAGFARARLMSNEASLKYLLLGAFATGFMLYGIALTYFATGSTLLPEIFRALQDNQNAATREAIPTSYLYSGMALLLIGLGFKTALVPFHQWTPDVYEGSPTPVTAFMATGAKAAAFAAFIRVFIQGFGAATVSEHWHHIVLILAVLTMTIGNVVAIAQDSLKRMLAYSSIAHAGYVMVGILATASALRAGEASMSLAHANASVLIYLAIYGLMNLGAFAVLVHLENQRARDPNWDAENANIKIGALRGLAWQKPGAAIALSIFLLSLAGIPPTAGFFGKFYLFMGAVDQGLIGLALVGVINSVISFYFYARPMVEMWMQDAPEISDIALGADGTAISTRISAARPAWSLAVTVSIVVCAIAVLGLAGAQAYFDWNAAGQLMPN